MALRALDESLSLESLSLDESLSASILSSKRPYINGDGCASVPCLALTPEILSRALLCSYESSQQYLKARAAAAAAAESDTPARLCSGAALGWLGIGFVGGGGERHELKVMLSLAEDLLTKEEPGACRASLSRRGPAHKGRAANVPAACSNSVVLDASEWRAALPSAIEAVVVEGGGSEVRSLAWRLRELLVGAFPADSPAESDVPVVEFSAEEAEAGRKPFRLLAP